jgi:hypothetical protein
MTSRSSRSSGTCLREICCKLEILPLMVVTPVMHLVFIDASAKLREWTDCVAGLTACACRRHGVGGLTAD